MDCAQGTYLELEPGPFACGFVRGRALCTDGKVRAVRFPSGGIADTFFSVPATVTVNGKTVSGYVTVETVKGYSTPTEDDPAIVRFVAYSYGKNGYLLPGIRPDAEEPLCFACGGPVSDCDCGGEGSC